MIGKFTKDKQNGWTWHDPATGITARTHLSAKITPESYTFPQGIDDKQSLAIDDASHRIMAFADIVSMLSFVAATFALLISGFLILYGTSKHDSFASLAGITICTLTFLAFRHGKNSITRWTSLSAALLNKKISMSERQETVKEANELKETKKEVIASLPPARKRQGL